MQTVTLNALYQAKSTDLIAFPTTREMEQLKRFVTNVAAAGKKQSHQDMNSRSAIAPDL